MVHVRFGPPCGAFHEPFTDPHLVPTSSPSVRGSPPRGACASSGHQPRRKRHQLRHLVQIKRIDGSLPTDQFQQSGPGVGACPVQDLQPWVPMWIDVGWNSEWARPNGGFSAPRVRWGATLASRSRRDLISSASSLCHRPDSRNRVNHPRALAGRSARPSESRTGRPGTGGRRGWRALPWPRRQGWAHGSVRPDPPSG